MKTVLVTGATGFVGRALCKILRARGLPVRAALRRPHGQPAGLDGVFVGEIGAATDWTAALIGVEVVIHLAARVHVMQETAADSLGAFRAVNVAGASTLAMQAARAGVRRLVFVSSIKVNGEATAGRAWTEADPPRPLDPYGVSKFEAETALREIAAATGLEVVVVRPPLVYGPGVGGNLKRMLGALRRGLPLPLGALDNRRSMIGVDNLADLLCVCAQHPAAAGETFLAADGEDISTPELIRRLGQALGRPVRLLPVPGAWLRCLGALTGRGVEIKRLCGSLQVDAGKARRLLGWVPPVSLAEGLRRMVQAGDGGEDDRAA